MSDHANQSNMENGASLVITHRVIPQKQAEYEQWLNEIGPICRASEGLLDWHIIRPISGLTDTYTVIIRYETELHLKNWMASEDRTRLIANAQKLLAVEDRFFIKSGLDFWFIPEGAKARLPVKWKQFLITWSAIYPLVLGVPLILIPLLRWLHIPENHLLDTLLLTALVVSLMVYVVMPRYTKLVHHWLFN